jgi:hypothetical protein
MPRVRLWERTFHLNGHTEGCAIMKERPSERCEDCVWWREGPFLCAGCPNNPETEGGGTNRPDESEAS